MDARDTFFTRDEGLLGIWVDAGWNQETKKYNVSYYFPLLAFFLYEFSSFRRKLNTYWFFSRLLRAEREMAWIWGLSLIHLFFCGIFRELLGKGEMIPLFFCCWTVL